MTGFSPTWFMEGLLHPLQTPSHLILLLGLGLLLGQQAKTPISFINKVVLFIPFLLAGFALNQTITLNWNNELIMLLLALSVGFLLVLRFNLAAMIMLMLVSSCGIMLGLDTSPVVIPGIRSISIYSWLTGSAVSMFVIISGLTLSSFILHRFLQGMILRVAGSWIASSALFVLTLLIAKQ